MSEVCGDAIGSSRIGHTTASVGTAFGFIFAICMCAATAVTTIPNVGDKKSFSVFDLEPKEYGHRVTTMRFFGVLTIMLMIAMVIMLIGMVVRPDLGALKMSGIIVMTICILNSIIFAGVGHALVNDIKSKATDGWKVKTGSAIHCGIVQIFVTIINSLGLTHFYFKGD